MFKMVVVLWFRSVVPHVVANGALHVAASVDELTVVHVVDHPRAVQVHGGLP